MAIEKKSEQLNGSGSDLIAHWSGMDSMSGFNGPGDLGCTITARRQPIRHCRQMAGDRRARPTWPDPCAVLVPGRMTS